MVRRNMPNERIMPVGFQAAWLNAFTGVQEFGGQSYSTGPNPANKLCTGPS